MTEQTVFCLGGFLSDRLLALPRLVHAPLTCYWLIVINAAADELAQVGGGRNGLLLFFVDLGYG